MCLVCEKKLFSISFFIVSALPWLTIGYFHNYFVWEKLLFLITFLLQGVLQFFYIFFTARDLTIDRICQVVQKNGFPPINSYCVTLIGIELESITLTYTGCLHFINCHIEKIYCEKLDDFTLVNSTVPIVIENTTDRGFWIFLDILFVILETRVFI